MRDADVAASVSRSALPSAEMRRRWVLRMWNALKCSESWRGFIRTPERSLQPLAPTQPQEGAPIWRLKQCPRPRNSRGSAGFLLWHASGSAGDHREETGVLSGSVESLSAGVPSDSAHGFSSWLWSHPRFPDQRWDRSRDDFRWRHTQLRLRKRRGLCRSAHGGHLLRHQRNRQRVGIRWWGQCHLYQAHLSVSRQHWEQELSDRPRCSSAHGWLPGGSVSPCNPADSFDYEVYQNLYYGVIGTSASAPDPDQPLEPRQTTTHKRQAEFAGLSCVVRGPDNGVLLVLGAAICRPFRGP